MYTSDRLNAPRDDDAIWASDFLNRKSEARQFAGFVKRRYAQLVTAGHNRAYSISVQVPYGLGKTYFLKGLAEMLSRDHPVAWVDAWFDDTIDDPLTSLTCALDRAISQFGDSKSIRPLVSAIRNNGKQIAAAVIKGSLTAGARLAIGEAATKEIAEALSGGSDSAIDGMAMAFAERQQKEYVTKTQEITRFKEDVRDKLRLISDAGKTKSLPLFIFIDELDRCRPVYAIRMLESIKHLMDIPGIFFVLGLERTQLGKAVRGMYGPDFNGLAYLRRFIDRGYRLAEPSMTQLCRHLIDRYGIDTARLSAPPDVESNPEQQSERIASFIAAWMESAREITARDVVSIMDMLQTFLTTWDYAGEIELAILIPMLINRHLDKSFTGYDPIDVVPSPKPNCVIHFGNMEDTIINIRVSMWNKISGISDLRRHDLYSNNVYSREGWIDRRLAAEISAHPKLGERKYRGPGSQVLMYEQHVDLVGRLTDEPV